MKRARQEQAGGDDKRLKSSSGSGVPAHASAATVPAEPQTATWLSAATSAAVDRIEAGMRTIWRWAGWPLLADEDSLSLLVVALMRPDVVEKDNAIALPPTSLWPDLKSGVLYVRYFYKDLWEAVLQRGLGDRRAAVLCGSPGGESCWDVHGVMIARAERIAPTSLHSMVIVRALRFFYPVAVGKSAFGLYVLYRAVKEGRMVVYNSRKGRRALFKGGMAYELPADVTNVRELNDRTAVYISDSLPPVSTDGAFTLVITSPKKDNWSEFVKTKGVMTLIAPRFKLDEMSQLRSAAFNGEPGCSEANMLALIDRWGPNPRNVLTHADNSDWQDRLSTVAEALTIATLEKALQTSTALDGVGSDENCHRHVDIVPHGALPGSSLSTTDPAYYKFHHAELVSQHVLGMYAEHLLKHDASEVYRFLHRAADDPAIADFRGRLYESAIVLPALRRGGQRMKQVPFARLSVSVGAQPASLQKQALDLSNGLPVYHFRSAADLRQLWATIAEDAVFVPYSKQFPVIDMILRVGGVPILANATVSYSHGIKIGNAAFAQLLDAIGLAADPSAEVSFVWLLPTEAFHNFKAAGSLLGASDKTLASGGSSTHAIGKRVAQYKAMLSVPLLTSA